MTAGSLHRVRGRIDVALDIIGRAIVGHDPRGTDASDRILEGLCVARKELAAAAAAIDDELEATARSDTRDPGRSSGATGSGDRVRSSFATA